MAKTSTIITRVKPEIKNQAENILEQLGLSMSGAVDMFLRQVIIQKGIPFEIKLPIEKPVDCSVLSKEEFDREIEKGIKDIEEGRVYSANAILEKMEIEGNDKL